MDAIKVLQRCSGIREDLGAASHLDKKGEASNAADLE